jgi:hypothetical protein
MLVGQEQAVALGKVILASLTRINMPMPVPERRQRRRRKVWWSRIWFRVRQVILRVPKGFRMTAVTRMPEALAVVEDPE